MGRTTPLVAGVLACAWLGSCAPASGPHPVERASAAPSRPVRIAPPPATSLTSPEPPPTGSSPVDASLLAPVPEDDPLDAPPMQTSLPMRSDVAPPPPIDVAEVMTETLLGSSIAFAWATRTGVLVITARSNVASDVSRLLPYPRAGAEAATMGRVVFTTQAWHATPGHLTRVLTTPTHLRPLDCVADEDCTLLDLPVQGTDDGALLVDHTACGVALAELALPISGPRTTWQSYDGAVIPALCRQPVRFTWNGTTMVAGTASTPLAETVTPIAREKAPGRFLEALLDAPLGELALQIATAPDGVHRHLLLLRQPARPVPAFMASVGASEAWASGRALEMAELWYAGDGKLQRMLSRPVALRALAEPLVVTRLPVELTSDMLRIGDPMAPCQSNSGFAPGVPLEGIEAQHVAFDGKASELLCAGREWLRFDGGAWVRFATTPR